MFTVLEPTSDFFFFLTNLPDANKKIKLNCFLSFLKKKKSNATVNPGQVAMTTCPTGYIMVSDPFI